MNDKLRAWWFRKQGLDGSLAGKSPAHVLAHSGWARSVGGSGPYLTLFARAGTSREDVDVAVKALDIHELPSARGCTYVLPDADFAIGLSVARGFGDDAQIATAKKYLGVTDDEIERVTAGVVAALAAGPLEPGGLKIALGDTVRNLGAEGKKRGTTSTLPLALGKLQTSGRIRRIPTNGRLDQQKYLYALWFDEVDVQSIVRDTAFTELARRYFHWTGPASVAHFQWFSGLGVKASKEAVAQLELVRIAPGSDLLLPPDEMQDFRAFTVPETQQIAVASSLDSLYMLRHDLAALLDEAEMPTLLDDKGIMGRPGGVAELGCNPIYDRGRIIGQWEYDIETSRIVWATFAPRTEAVAAVIERTEAYIRDELGDARSFSMDSTESRKPRIAALRGLAG